MTTAKDRTLVDTLDNLTEGAADAIELLIRAAEEHTTTTTRDMTAAIRVARRAQAAIYDEFNAREEGDAS